MEFLPQLMNDICGILWYHEKNKTHFDRQFLTHLLEIDLTESDVESVNLAYSTSIYFELNGLQQT